MSKTPYTIGQTVEVIRPDFEVPGFPKRWFRGTVTKVTPVRAGIVDVMVVLDAGMYEPQLVGPRGGNKNIRAVSE